MKKGNRAAAQEAKKKDRHVKQQLRRARQVRKYGDESWRSDWKKFVEQLSHLSLTIKDVAGDGNCMFRAIADQLEGDPNRHDHYRQLICNFIERHDEDFAPFVEDDRTLAQHLSEMRTAGCWGGHMELQAASRALGVNFCIHQLSQPRWEIVNHQGNSRNPVRILHLSYHDDNHYASVRNKNEPANHTGPPTLISLPTTSPGYPQASSSSSAMDSSDFANWQEELVMRSTTATNVYFVRAVLIEVDGDTDAAIEYIISLTSDGELEESFQNEFAYEHGIFPPGGFGDMNPEAFLEDNTTSDLGFDPALLKFAADVDPSELMSLEDVSTASTSTATSSNSTQVKNNESTVATTESSISSPEQHTAPGQFRRDSSPSSPSRQKPHQEHQAATKVKGTKKHSHGSPASSSSEASSAVHPKLAKFQQNQHISNKQRNAMRRMEKEAPPATITKPLPEATAASGSGESDAVPDLGSLRI